MDAAFVYDRPKTTTLQRFQAHFSHLSTLSKRISYFITINETWIKYYTPESNKQSTECLTRTGYKPFENIQKLKNRREKF